MTKLYNRLINKDYRRQLRRVMPKGERLFWSRIRNKQIGYKFKRQYGVGPFIVDFYCPELHLVIEIDGLTHYTKEGTVEDDKRHKYLESKVLFVKRYHSYQVFEDLDLIVYNLKLFCDDLKLVTPSQPPPC